MTSTPHRTWRHFTSLVLAMMVLATACGVTPSTAPPASGSSDAAPVDSAASDQDESASDTPDALAFVEDPPPSAAFCEASASIWVHATALDLVADGASAKLTSVALANVDEWLEKSTLLGEGDEGTARQAMLDNFAILQNHVRDDFDLDWAAYQGSDRYADDRAAQDFEQARIDLVSFIEAECNAPTSADMLSAAAERADALEAEFGSPAGSITPSDTVPNHSIYTHGSGRFIVTFPSHWDHEEVAGDAIVELIAAADLELLQANGAVDGVRLRLLPAETLTEFAGLLSATHIANSCDQTDTQIEQGSVRVTIEESYECDAEFGASLIGQYSPDRKLGVVVEASYGQLSPTRGDVIRLNGIVNSLLWS